MHKLLTPCLPFKQTSRTLRIQWQDTKREHWWWHQRYGKSMKQHSLTAQRINLVTKTSQRLSLLYKSFSWNNEGFSLKRRLQVLDGFITLLVASILSNKRSRCLCVTSETKPNQDKWIPRDVIVGIGGRRERAHYFSLPHHLDTTAQVQQMCPFGDRDTRQWQSRGQHTSEEDCFHVEMTK